MGKKKIAIIFFFSLYKKKKKKCAVISLLLQLKQTTEYARINLAAHNKSNKPLKINKKALNVNITAHNTILTARINTAESTDITVPNMGSQSSKTFRSHCHHNRTLE